MDYIILVFDWVCVWCIILLLDLDNMKPWIISSWCLTESLCDVLFYCWIWTILNLGLYNLGVWLGLCVMYYSIVGSGIYETLDYVILVFDLVCVWCIILLLDLDYIKPWIISSWCLTGSVCDVLYYCWIWTILNLGLYHLGVWLDLCVMYYSIVGSGIDKVAGCSGIVHFYNRFIT